MPGKPPVTYSNLENRVEELASELRSLRPFLEADHRETLLSAIGGLIHHRDSIPAASTEEEVDLLSEVRAQLDAVKAMRKEIFRGKSLIGDVKQAKDYLTASTQLLSLLSKVYEDVWNQDRLRRVELATVEAIKTLPDKNQEAFFKRLEEELTEG